VAVEVGEGFRVVSDHGVKVESLRVGEGIDVVGLALLR
jgi:hypothetical protein